MVLPLILICPCSPRYGWPETVSQGLKLEWMNVGAAAISSNLLLRDKPPFGVSSWDLRHSEPAAFLRADGSDVAERMWPLPLGPGRTVSVPPLGKWKKQKENSQLTPISEWRLTLGWRTWHREALCSGRKQSSKCCGNKRFVRKPKDFDVIEGNAALLKGVSDCKGKTIFFERKLSLKSWKTERTHYCLQQSIMQYQTWEKSEKPDNRATLHLHCRPTTATVNDVPINMAVGLFIPNIDFKLLSW